VLGRRILPAGTSCRLLAPVFDLLNMDDFDLIVVGAGPGGSNAASVALRAGLRVAQIDAARFPRIKPCAGGITLKAAMALVETLHPSVCRSFKAIEFNVWGGRKSRFTHQNPVLHTVCRPEFDNRLVRQNLLHDNFTFVDGCPVTGVAYDGRFRVQTRRGTFSSRQVIGADGAYSIVNRVFRIAAPAAVATAIEINLPAEIESSMVPCLDYGAIDRGYGWVFPKGDHVSVGLYTLSPRTRNVRARLLAYIRSKALPFSGDSLGRLEAFKVPIGGFRLRVPSCPVYVVGDAGGFADAITGEGIYHALESGRLAGEVAVDVACGRKHHRAYYSRLWRSVLSETAISSFVARHFYRDIARGIRILESPLVWRLLIQGAVTGATYSECVLKSAMYLFRSYTSGAAIEQGSWQGVDPGSHATVVDQSSSAG
jgi:geranylgeranyl reductase family protein